jgi:hypothetical protein
MCGSIAEERSLSINAVAPAEPAKLEITGDYPDMEKVRDLLIAPSCKKLRFGRDFTELVVPKSVLFCRGDSE